MKYSKEFVGEKLGTFIMVLLGSGVLAVSVLFDGIIHGTSESVITARRQ